MAFACILTSVFIVRISWMLWRSNASCVQLLACKILCEDPRWCWRYFWSWSGPWVIQMAWEQLSKVSGSLIDLWYTLFSSWVCTPTEYSPRCESVCFVLGTDVPLASSKTTLVVPTSDHGRHLARYSNSGHAHAQRVVEYLQYIKLTRNYI